MEHLKKELELSKNQNAALKNEIQNLMVEKQVLDGLYGEKIRENFQFHKQCVFSNTKIQTLELMLNEKDKLIAQQQKLIEDQEKLIANYRRKKKWKM